jgi:hypothetical protein
MAGDDNIDGVTPFDPPQLEADLVYVSVCFLHCFMSDRQAFENFGIDSATRFLTSLTIPPIRVP